MTLTGPPGTCRTLPFVKSFSPTASLDPAAALLSFDRNRDGRELCLDVNRCRGALRGHGIEPVAAAFSAPCHTHGQDAPGPADHVNMPSGAAEVLCDSYQSHYCHFGQVYKSFSSVRISPHLNFNPGGLRSAPLFLSHPCAPPVFVTSGRAWAPGASLWEGQDSGFSRGSWGGAWL